MYHKLYGLHQLIGFSRVKIPQIVLIILVQPFKVFLKQIPPLIDFFQTHVFHFFCVLQALFQPYKKIRG